MTDPTTTPARRGDGPERPGVHDDPVRRDVVASAGQQGLGHIDLEALLHVMQAEQRGDPVTSGRLGELLGVTSGAATGVIDRLERAGHVRRSRDDADRRRVLVHYSEAARAVAGQFFGPLGRLSATVMDQFDDAELRTVQRFLADMSVAMAEHARSTEARPTAPAAAPDSPTAPGAAR
jgi:DNA-binding MarR family transcriptional regulator